MSLNNVDIARDERGTTLIELMVALSAGLVILVALSMVILVTLHGTDRVAARVDATQRGRLAISKIMEELHTACVTPEVAPIKAESNGTVLRFIHQTGSAVSPTPIWSVVSLSNGKLSQQDYSVTGTAPNWAPSTELGPSRTLLTGVTPIPPNSWIFSYYAYSGGTISETSQEVPLNSTNSLLTVEVKVALMAAPATTPVKDAGAGAAVEDAATLRLTPPSFNEGSPAKPCG